MIVTYFSSRKFRSECKIHYFDLHSRNRHRHSSPAGMRTATDCGRVWPPCRSDSKVITLLIYWTFFILGLASLTGQIVLLREILGIFYGTEISIGMFLGTWLAEIGAGASVGALLVKRLDIDFRPIFLHSLVALGCSLIFQIFIISFKNRIRSVGIKNVSR